MVCLMLSCVEGMLFASPLIVDVNAVVRAMVSLFVMVLVRYTRCRWPVAALNLRLMLWRRHFSVTLRRSIRLLP